MKIEGTTKALDKGKVNPSPDILCSLFSRFLS